MPRGLIRRLDEEHEGNRTTTWLINLEMLGSPLYEL